MDIQRDDPVENQRLEFLPRFSLVIEKDKVHLLFEYLWFGFKIKL